MDEATQEKEDGFTPVPLWSIKLINGEQIITELYESDIKNNPNFVMVNPIVVIHTITPDGQFSSATAYDKTTDEDTFEIHESAFLSEPKLVNDFYKTFYVKALLFEYTKKARTELEDIDNDTSVGEQKKHEIERALEQAAQFLCERFGVNFEKETPDVSEPPKNRVLH